MKRILLVILVITIIIAVCTACAIGPIHEGEVYAKEHKEAYTSVTQQWVRYGKVNVVTPKTTHHPERWVISFKAYNEESQKWKYNSCNVSKELYDSVNIGDWFIIPGA